MASEDNNLDNPNLPNEPGSWYALVWRVISAPKTLFLCLLVVIVFYFAAYATGHDILEAIGLPKSIPNSDVATSKDFPTSDKKLAECITKAIATNKPYVMLSVTEIVHIHMDKEKEDDIKISDFTIIYTLLLLRDITREDRLFKELFNSASSNFKYNHVYGSAEELLRGQGETYDVIFEGNKGEIITIATSGRYTHKLPYPERYVLAEQIHLSHNEDTWNYPNQEDMIREYTLMLTSDNASIEPVGQAAAKRLDDKRKLFADNVRFSRVSDQNARPSISAKWENIMPGEELAIHYKWQS